MAGRLGQGQRDNALTSMAGSMRRRGAEFAEICAALLEMNERRCKPPLSGPQVNKIVRSVCRYPPAAGSAVADCALESAHDGDGRIATHELAAMITADSHFAVDLGGKLYVYQNGVYQPTGEGYVRRRVKALLTELDRPKQWTSHKTDEVVKYIAVDVPRLWEWPHAKVVNVQNGLLHVVTREFTPHSPKFLSSIQLPVKYDPEAECPAWEKFVNEVFPEDAQDLAWEIVAWLMTPYTSIPKAVLLMGDGANGKSTYLRAIMTFLGKHNTGAVSLHRLEGDRFSAARLVNKLANICPDLPSNDLASTSVFKALTVATRC